MAQARTRQAARKKTAVRPAARNVQRRAKAQQGGERLFDYTLLLVVLFLIAFGLIMLYSTSSYEAGIEFGDPAYYLKRQAVSSLVGIAAMVVVAFIPYQILESEISYAIYGIAAALVISLRWIGRTVNGATRWIYIGPVSIQPAEACKVAVILVTALYIVKAQGQRRNTMRGFQPLLQTWWGLIKGMIPALLLGILIYGISNNLSSALIVMAIAAGMLFVAVKDYWRFFGLAGLACAAAVYWVYHAVTANSEDFGFRSQRVLTWLSPEDFADGYGFQTLQGLYGIGSGGMFGKGLGQSMQKLGYIPEAQNDMIFSIICEELGMFGAVCVITLFIILCWRLVIIATNAEDLFGALIAVGVMTHISVQVILNIAVVTNSIPNTGVTLPFVSYGGSSVLFLLAEMGLVISVSRSIRTKE